MKRNKLTELMDGGDITITGKRVSKNVDARLGAVLTKLPSILYLIKLISKLKRVIIRVNYFKLTGAQQIYKWINWSP